MKEIDKELKKRLRDSVEVDWTNREKVRAELRTEETRFSAVHSGFLCVRWYQ
jgi:hypothetical protein